MNKAQAIHQTHGMQNNQPYYHLFSSRILTTTNIHLTPSLPSKLQILDIVQESQDLRFTYLSYVKLEAPKQTTKTKALGLKHTLGLQVNHSLTQVPSLMIFAQDQTRILKARRWSFLPSLGSFKMAGHMEDKMKQSWFKIPLILWSNKMDGQGFATWPNLGPFFP